MNHRSSWTIGVARRLLSFAALATLATAGYATTPEIREVPVHFAKGETGATLKGKLKGHETVDYTLQARAGQSMVVLLKTTTASAYFNVLPPGSETALFVGSTSGERFEGTLPADGIYRIRVYLMRSAARRNEKASYTLDVGVSEAASTPQAGPVPSR